MEHQPKTAIVTGGYGAIGKAIAGGMARKGYRVTLVGRDLAQLQKASESIRRQASNPDIFFEQVDLGRQAEIEEFSRRWKGPLHVLVNNAATGPRKRMETPEGIEVQWAVNVMGYVWMMNCFIPFLEGLPDARIVNVASYWAGGMDLRDPEFRARHYDNDEAYRQSKQANRMLTLAYAERLRAKHITVNACHPGDVNSKLSNYFGFGGHETPGQGAATPLYLALSEDVKGVTGKYYEHLRQVSCPFMKDRDAVERLFSYCSGVTGS